MWSVILFAQVIEQVEECLDVAESRLRCIEMTALTNAISHPVGYVDVIENKAWFGISGGDGGK